MRYFIKEGSFSDVLPVVKSALGRAGDLVVIEVRSAVDVRLVPVVASTGTSVPFQARPGCTVLLKGESVLVQCAEACLWLEKKIASYLSKRGWVRGVETLSECPRIERRAVVPDHLAGRPVSEEVMERTRAERAAKRANRPRRFRTVIEAVRAGLAQVGSWVYATERALESAAESQFRDPDYIFDLIIALGEGAKKNAGGGVDGDWKTYLYLNGRHDFVANTSKNTVEMYHSHYHVVWEGRDVCIGAHVRCGNGSAQDLARVYLATPLRPGGPVILGHIGSHLPLPK